MPYFHYMGFEQEKLKYYRISSFYIPILFVVALIGSLVLFRFFPHRLFDSSTIAVIMGIIFSVWGTIMVVWCEFSHHNLAQLFSGTLTCNDLSRGIYKYSRHPGTIGFLLMFFGFGFFVNSITIILVAWLVSSILSWVVIPIVENHMKAFCGEEYIKYCSKVRMWL